MTELAAASALDSSAKLIAYTIFLLAVACVIVMLIVRYVRQRQADARRAGLAWANVDGRLSRSSAAPVNNPLTFGGGAMSAAPTNRRETVTYGYLAVAEEYVSLDSGAAWSVLSVTLPGWAPYLVVDHESALGRPGVPPAGGETIATGDPAFDATFTVVSVEADVVTHVLTDAVRRLLEHYPLQRVSLSGRTLLLRTFDHNQLTDTVLTGLNLAASDVLATAPAFVMDRRPPVGAVAISLPRTTEPMRQGFYGSDASTE